MKFLFNLWIWIIYTTCAIGSDVVVVTKSNITITTPGKEVIPLQVPYKSVHVRYSLPNNDDQWNIVAIEPLLPKLENSIQQITVHLCESAVYRVSFVWYDDQTPCPGDQSMLIYQWMSHAPKSTFQLADGFRWDQSKFVVFSVKYSQEQRTHENNAVGIRLHISTAIPHLHTGTIFVGNNRRNTRFSCRSSNYPRLLTAVKPLFPKTINDSWRIYVIRSRNFGRKLVQFVGDSTVSSSENQTDLALVTADIFLIPGDYIMVECPEVFESMCQFLIYFSYKNLPYKYVDENAFSCSNDNYPDLFRLIPPRSNVEELIAANTSSIGGTTVFLIVCALLFFVWISIIIGCIIMRRIRGLVNFRSEPSTPYSAHGDKMIFPQKRGNTQTQQKIAIEGDRIAQMDVEHMGLMS